MNRTEIKKKRFNRRRKGIKASLANNPGAPRLSVYRSLKHIYAQIIDDTAGTTLVAASTVDGEVRSRLNDEMTKKDVSKVVGSVLAERAAQKQIESVKFDRNGFLYHGRVQALADGAREGGLKF